MAKTAGWLGGGDFPVHRRLEPGHQCWKTSCRPPCRTATPVWTSRWTPRRPPRVHHSIVGPTPPADRRGAIALHARGHERLIAVCLSREEPSASRRHERPRGALPFPADLSAPRVGPVGPRVGSPGSVGRVRIGGGSVPAGPGPPRRAASPLRSGPAHVRSISLLIIFSISLNYRHY